MSRPTVPVHPVPVDVAPLAIVVTRGEGGDAITLVQLSKVCAYKRCNFRIRVGVIGTRPPIVFLPFPCAIWSFLFRRRCLLITLRCFGRWLFVLSGEQSWGNIFVIFGRWTQTLMELDQGTVEHLLGQRCLCGVSRLPNTKSTSCSLSGHCRLDKYSQILRVGECNP